MFTFKYFEDHGDTFLILRDGDGKPLAPVKPTKVAKPKAAKPAKAKPAKKTPAKPRKAAA